MSYAHSEALVSTEWLAAHIGDPELRIVDGSFKLPGVMPTAAQDYAERHIPGAVFFDIDIVADQSNPLPHMLPRPDEFAAHMSRLGLGDGNFIIVYDGSGWNSAWRIWWMLRLFGHDRVALLSGGLRKWLNERRSVTKDVPAPKPARFTPRCRPELVRDKAALLANLEGRQEIVIDARPAARFAGIADEPRPGLRRGHIPDSRNLPYESLIDPESRIALPAADIERQLRDAGLSPNKPIVASCGSGVSACAIAFAMHLIGWPDAAIYDGSWSEWGKPGNTPVETGAAR